MTKCCTACGQEKLNTPQYFHRDKHQADGLTGACKECRRDSAKRAMKEKREAEYMQEYRKKNSEAIKRTQRKTHVKMTYGISMEQYYAMLQDDCPICKRPLERPCIDHCHTSGEVRGVICTRCNSGLGMFGDDEATMWRAMEYLKNPPAARLMG